VAASPGVAGLVYVGGSNGVSRTTDGGTTWAPTGAGPGPDLRAIAPHPSAAGTVYATSFGSGVFRSTNGGASWETVNGGLTDLNTIPIAIDPQTPATVYVGTTGGVFKTTDAGASWVPSNTGLPTFVLEFAIEFLNPATVYASTYAGLYKTTNGGGSWALTGLGNAPASSVSTTFGNPSSLHVSTFDSGVQWSVGGGGSWTPINQGLPSPTWSGVLDAPDFTATLFLGSAGVWQVDGYFPVELTGFAVE